MPLAAARQLPFWLLGPPVRWCPRATRFALIVPMTIYTINARAYASAGTGEGIVSSLVFVHGIGVRAPAAEGEHPNKATCRAIRFELALKGIDWTLVECGWGDDLGA